MTGRLVSLSLNCLTVGVFFTGKMQNSAYGASLAGGAFDLANFLKQPQTILRFLSWVSDFTETLASQLASCHCTEFSLTDVRCQRPPKLVKNLFFLAFCAVNAGHYLSVAFKHFNELSVKCKKKGVSVALVDGS